MPSLSISSIFLLQSGLILGLALTWDLSCSIFWISCGVKNLIGCITYSSFQRFVDFCFEGFVLWQFVWFESFF
jgi:hypothetical protein